MSKCCEREIRYMVLWGQTTGLDLSIWVRIGQVKGGFSEDVMPELTSERGTGLNEVKMVGNSPNVEGNIEGMKEGQVGWTRHKRRKLTWSDAGEVSRDCGGPCVPGKEFCVYPKSHRKLLVAVGTQPDLHLGMIILFWT